MQTRLAVARFLFHVTVSSIPFYSCAVWAQEGSGGASEVKTQVPPSAPNETPATTGEAPAGVGAGQPNSAGSTGVATDSVARGAENKPAKRVYREKEAEGSEAKNRFTGEGPVVKSQYRSRGQALEVDPD